MKHIPEFCLAKLSTRVLALNLFFNVWEIASVSVCQLIFVFYSFRLCACDTALLLNIQV